MEKRRRKVLLILFALLIYTVTFIPQQNAPPPTKMTSADEIINAVTDFAISINHLLHVVSSNSEVEEDEEYKEPD